MPCLALVRAVLALPYDRWYHSMHGRHQIAKDTQERLRRGQLTFCKSSLKDYQNFYRNYIKSFKVGDTNYFPLGLTSSRFHHFSSLISRTNLSTHKPAKILVTEYLISFPSRKHFKGVVTTVLLEKLCVSYVILMGKDLGRPDLVSSGCILYGL